MLTPFTKRVTAFGRDPTKAGKAEVCIEFWPIFIGVIHLWFRKSEISIFQTLNFSSFGCSSQSTSKKIIYFQ